jgi:hypothetical protein
MKNNFAAAQQADGNNSSNVDREMQFKFKESGTSTYSNLIDLVNEDGTKFIPKHGTNELIFGSSDKSSLIEPDKTYDIQFTTTYPNGEGKPIVNEFEGYQTAKIEDKIKSNIEYESETSVKVLYKFNKIHSIDFNNLKEVNTILTYYDGEQESLDLDLDDLGNIYSNDVDMGYEKIFDNLKQPTERIESAGTTIIDNDGNEVVKNIPNVTLPPIVNQAL